MLPKYEHRTIEQKWREKWEKEEPYRVKEEGGIPKEKRRYVLDMFPYPSAAGLHVGHPEGYTATDIYARYLRMRGFSALHPMGWDAFGLPAENYAIKQGIHPRASTWNNIDNFRRQIKSVGFSYDWSREVNTADPRYYKWTQWFFLLLYKNGLAYRKKAPVNWCASCQTVLAREQVTLGRCERCKNSVAQKELEQWFFKITDYAERLLSDLEKIDWPEPIKLMQRNWIGKSVGAEIVFEIKVKSQESKVKSASQKLKVFTTRADTLFGATYLVVAPEHPMLKNYELRITNYEDVQRYVEASKNKTELERTDLAKEKTGVELRGIKAAHPATGELLPVLVADYVVMSYGTGAIMGVPAHDSRDFEFAKKYGLEIRQVIAAKIKDPENAGSFNGSSSATALQIRQWHGKDTIAQVVALVKSKDSVAPAPGFAPGDPSVPPVNQRYAADQNATPKEVYQIGKCPVKEAYTGDGLLINSEQFNGLPSQKAREQITQWLRERGLGGESVQYRLRDWLISRQRYWGAPIPIIYCASCGEIPVLEESLPVLLPEDVDFKPTGESPLKRSKSFHEARRPRCGRTEGVLRESDTMDTFVCSSWYLYRYTDPHNDSAFASKENMRYWLPVDVYVGGAEHAVMHLLYARFFCKVLHDLGYVDFDEPFKKLINQGLILAEDGRKMSKSLGNVINPDDIIDLYGADALRLYEMFMGPLEDPKPWSTQGIKGVKRFLEKVWDIIQNSKFKIQNSNEAQPLRNRVAQRLLHKTIKKVTEDIEAFKFNTAIAQLMIFFNEIKRYKEELPSTEFLRLTAYGLRLLAPFAPHIAEELWQKQGNGGSIFKERWPEANPKFLKETMTTIVIQVNGKRRGEIAVSEGESREEALKRARELPQVASRLIGKEIQKEIYVENKIVNFVV